MAHDWILLIYSLPSQPSRKRAYVWRELKKLGATYLRDGVAVLPRHPRLEEHLEEIARRIEEYEGTADVLLSPGFRREREEVIIQRFQEERTAEYREFYRACVRFLRDVLHDVDADDFGFPDVDKLESELARLGRWREQVVERDYFEAPGSGRTREILEKCERAFDHFVHTASTRDETDGRDTPDDVFERLGGSGDAAAALEDLPL